MCCCSAPRRASRRVVQRDAPSPNGLAPGRRRFTTFARECSVMRLALPVAGLLAAVLALACSRDEPPARVAARVNGEAISIDRLRQALAHVNALGERPAAPGRLMEHEIDRELLAQKAR